MCHFGWLEVDRWFVWQLFCRFHLLSDFDEGKRSCRRKLERHNNRRRRKSVDSKGAVDSEPPGASRCEDIICDDDSGKGMLTFDLMQIVQ